VPTRNDGIHPAAACLKIVTFDAHSTHALPALPLNCARSGFEISETDFERIYAITNNGERLESLWPD
jgi:hypothetical protein